MCAKVFSLQTSGKLNQCLHSIIGPDPAQVKNPALADKWPCRLEYILPKQTIFNPVSYRQEVVSRQSKFQSLKSRPSSLHPAIYIKVPLSQFPFPKTKVTGPFLFRPLSSAVGKTSTSPESRQLAERKKDYSLSSNSVQNTYNIAIIGLHCYPLFCQVRDKFGACMHRCVSKWDIC